MVKLTLHRIRGKPMRTLLILLALSGIACASPDPMEAPPPPGYYHFQKILYQNDSGFPDDHAYFQRILHNISNHMAAIDGKGTFKVVSFGPGVKLFVMAQTDKELAGELDTLRGKGVKFLICRNTLRGMNLTPDKLYGVTWQDVVPSGVAEIARLQGQGYVFEHP